MLGRRLIHEFCFVQREKCGKISAGGIRTVWRLVLRKGERGTAFPRIRCMKPIHFGIDISDRNVELVALERKHGGTTLGLRGSTEIPAGTMDRGTILHEDTFATVLKALIGRVFG